MTDFTRTQKQANCEACLLAEAMKNCRACVFFVEYQRATPEDIDRIYVQLWGYYPALYIGE